MAILTLQEVPVTGASVTAVAAAAGGDSAQAEDDIFLYVKNGDAVSHTVTMVTPRTVKGVALADPAVVVAAGATALVPLNRTLYRDPVNGRASWTYDAATSVTVAAVRLKK